MFKVLMKVLVIFGMLFAALAAFQYFTKKQEEDYIEIYNDDSLDGEYF